jgi:hypothetical protein
MSFGAPATISHNPSIPKPANTPIQANSSVLLAGLMGLRPRNNPALSNNFAPGASTGLARRPALAKRTTTGGN